MLNKHFILFIFVYGVIISLLKKYLVNGFVRTAQLARQLVTMTAVPSSNLCAGRVIAEVGKIEAVVEFSRCPNIIPPTIFMFKQKSKIFEN